MADLINYNRHSGIYDVADDQWDRYVESRLKAAEAGNIPPTEFRRADGRILQYQAAVLPQGGRMLTYFDITELKRREEELAEKEAQLEVALDNMPGALVYTDNDLNIVIRNEHFTEMYRVPEKLLQPGQPYPNFLRYLAENGYYGDGDIDALVAERTASLRNPSGRKFTIRPMVASIESVAVEC